MPYLDPAVGDHKVIWELNRHQYWLQLGRAAWLTGDPRYARAIVQDLESWLDANPPLIGINWASMLEIGFRSISWTWAMHALLQESGIRNQESVWLVDMLVALDRQLTHVEHNLSYYFSPNTHLTGEALALYVVGAALPELAASARWMETGRRVLLDEIDRQVLPDGGHAERSMHYQRYTLDFYLLALITAERIEDTAAIARFTDAVSSLAAFTRAMADDQGTLPLIGDDDGGMLWPIAGRACTDARDSLALAALVLGRPDLAPWGVPEEVFWIAGRTAIERAPTLEARPPDRRHQPSRALPDTGYVMVRDGSGGHAVLDAGAHGYMNAGHAHAAALSLAVTLAHRPLLVDPGTSAYTIDPKVRDRMRGTMSHNTVMVDNLPQSQPAGPFHWHTRANARIEGWRNNPAFDWVEASHDGYSPLEHRRTLLRAADEGWLVADEILGEGHHESATHWHFDPAWVVSVDRPGRLRASHPDGAEAWLLYDSGHATLVTADEESGLGWHAPTYGTLVPAWAARITCEGVAPLSSLTWIAGSSGRHAPPTLERVAVARDSRRAAIAARVTTGPIASVFLLRPAATTSSADLRCAVADYQTDARIFHYRASRDRLAAIDIIDGRHALALRPGWISVDASHPVRDLHLSVEDPGGLSLWASAPPPELRLQGTSLGGVRAVRLNGREVALDALGSRERPVIRAGDWREWVTRDPAGPAGGNQLPKKAETAGLSQPASTT